MFIGNQGSGKTTGLEGFIRQDIEAGRGQLIIDPHADLYERLLNFLCYRKAVGCRVPDVLLFNPSGDWVLPFNPFERPKTGDLSAAVDRLVQSVLRAWGQHTPDETPRLAKWLKAIVTAIMESGLTILEAAYVLDQQAHQARQLLAGQVRDPVIARLIRHLSAYKLSDFLLQTESTESRLLRFFCSDVIRRFMGIGESRLDFRRAMDEGQIILVNLGLSPFLSEEQQRLFGTLFINGCFEAAMQRPTGARPFYLTVDEAAMFVTPEMGQMLEQTRKKGLHVTLSFQHPAQFKTVDLRLYKSIKNTHTKLVFAVPDRQDATELADDLFDNLTVPQLKFMHRHLTHLLEDIRQTSTTHSTGHGYGFTQSRERSQSTQSSQSSTVGQTEGSSRSTETSTSQGHSLSRGQSREIGMSKSRSHSEHEEHNSGFSETNSRQETSGENSSETIHEHKREGVLFSDSGEDRSKTTGQSHSRTVGHSRTETGSHSYGRGDTETESQTESTGTNRSVSVSRLHQRGETVGSSSGRSFEQSESESLGDSRSQGFSHQQNHSRTRSVTDQPGVRHTAFWEEDPEHFTLEERRWQAAELIMRQPVGHCFARSGSEFLPLQLKPPRPFYILPSRLSELSREFYQKHCLAQAEAGRLVAERQQRFASAIAAGQLPDGRPAGPVRPIIFTAPKKAERSGEQEIEQQPEVAIWNLEAPSASEQRQSAPPRRGPKPDLENHVKVAAIIGRLGPNWSEAENLAEVCEQLDNSGIPIPKTWPHRSDGKARSWERARQHYPHLVVKAIRDKLKAAGGTDGQDGNSRQLPLDI